MRAVTKILAVAAAALSLGGTAVSAAVVCNDDGDCWRVTRLPNYDPELRLRIYDDDWEPADEERYHWREAGFGPGYWRDGVWVTIED